jgi:hypothetical protein
MRRRMRLWTAFLVCALAMCAARNGAADARSDYLINMLKTGATYRVRVQAATTLGAIRCKDAAASLQAALADESDLVVIAAANALAQIGDPGAIPALELALKKPPSPPAQSQLEISLRILKALVQGDADTQPADETPRYLIRVDAMGNSSSCPRDDLSETMRKLVIARIGRDPGVVLQSPEMGSEQVNAKSKKEKLAAFILSGSIIRLERKDSQLSVKISLNVFSNPGYSLLAMPSAEGSVAVGAGTLEPEAERAEQDKALKAVVDGLVASVLRSLDEMHGSRPSENPPEGE